MFTILIICLCLLTNAVLSCSEMAFVTIDDKLLRKKVLAGDKNAAWIELMGESPERILSVVQIGITLVGAISGAVAGAGAEDKLAPLLMYLFGISEQMAGSIAITIIVAPLTVLSVIVGELVPKSLAIRYSMPIILTVAPGLRIAEKLLGPLVNPMEKVTDFILKIMMKSKITPEESSETEELSLKGLRQEYRQYFHNLLDLDSKLISSIMVPWEKVDRLSSIAEPEEVSSLILSTSRTRISVINENDGKPKLKKGESVVFEKNVYGFVFKNLEVDFESRLAKVDIHLSVVAGLNRNLFKSKSIIQDTNPRFTDLVNNLNRKLVELESVCVNAENEIVYATKMK